ncbi:hypothetical protein [Streptomyces sp. NPDC001537]
MWAPEIHFLDGKWYLYYSAAQAGAACCDTQRTHVLESSGTDRLAARTHDRLNALTQPARRADATSASRNKTQIVKAQWHNPPAHDSRAENPSGPGRTGLPIVLPKTHS